MKASSVGAVLGVALAMTGILSCTDDRRDGATSNLRQDSGMQAVSIGTRLGEPGYGWRYFTDAREGRAVVISPGGDYYYSHGEGLELVFKATTGA